MKKTMYKIIICVFKCTLIFDKNQVQNSTENKTSVRRKKTYLKMRRPESYENNLPAAGRIQKKDALQRPFSDIQNKVKSFLKYIR